MDQRQPLALHFPTAKKLLPSHLKPQSRSEPTDLASGCLSTASAHLEMAERVEQGKREPEMQKPVMDQIKALRGDY